MASRLVGRPLQGERAITVDQTNQSVIVGDEVVVKWLLPPVLAPHPGCRAAASPGRPGSRPCPRFLGVEQRDEMVLAVATEYVPGALDGWDWFVDDVDAWLRGRSRSRRSLRGRAAWVRSPPSCTPRWPTCSASTVAARTYHLQAVDRLGRRAAHRGWRRGRAAGGARAAHPPGAGAVGRGSELPAHRIHGDLHAGQFLRADDRC